MPESEGQALDAVLKEIGQLARYQLFLIGMFSVAIIIHSTVHIAFVFAAQDVNYRCKVPNCEADPPEYNPSWLKNAVPFKNDKPVKCEMYLHQNGSEQTECIDEFNQNVTESCSEFVYETDEVTILHDFDLHCEENLWKLTFVGTVNSIGQFVGLPISGVISDKYGRRVTLIIGMVLSGTCGIIRSFVNHYEWFATFEFLDALFGAGAYSCAFILGVELVGPGKRVLVSTLICCSYAIGEILTGVVAWLVMSWRPLTQILYSLPYILLTYFYLTPESARWLLAQQRNEEAINILQKAAKVNGRTISEENLKMISSPSEKTVEPVTYPISAMFKSTILMMRFINSCFCWITCAFVFYGLTLNSVSLSGNSHIDFILTSLVEIPGYVASYFFVDRIGRKLSLCGSFLITSVSCIGFMFVSSDLYALQLILYLLGKFGATIAFAVCYIISSEIFPTPLRHSLLATCSMFGRIGSMVAPQMPLLEQVWRPLPLIMFAGMSTVAGFLSLLFPETVNVKLPDTIAEAEEIGKPNRQQTKM